MSYSYIKTVFPKFENTTIINSQKIFNGPTTTTPLKVIGINTETPDNSEINKPQGEDKFYLTQSELPIENFSSQDNMMNKDNLHYYNIPVDKNMMNIENFTPQDNLHYYNIPVDKNMMNIENFTPENKATTVTPPPQPEHIVVPAVNQKSNCDSIKDHIKDCAICKEVLYKNFNMENKKNDFNQEIFELISYCIFAVFILFLLDKISTRR
jgi:hypothetical protein